MPRPPSPSGHRNDGLRHADGVLLCPRCRTPLDGSDHELGIAWRCARCRGQSLNFSQFRRMVPEDGARDIWLEAMKNPAAPGQPTRCPECLTTMDAVLIPFRDHTIELDICRHCQRLWLDAGEENLPAALPGKPAESLKPVRTQFTQSQADRAATEAMLSVLEHRADRQNRTRDRRRYMIAASVAAVAGIVAWIAMHSHPARIRLRTALAVSAGAYYLTLFFFLR